MAVTRKDYSGQTATVTMMQFRREPGDVLEFARYGGTVNITKNGKHIASLVPAPTVINSDGTWAGKKPLTFGLDLGSEYGADRARLRCDGA